MKPAKPPLNARVNHMIRVSNARRKAEEDRKAAKAERLRADLEHQAEKRKLEAEIEVLAREECRAKQIARGMDAKAEMAASYDVDSDGNCTPVPIEDDDAKAAPAAGS